MQKSGRNRLYCSNKKGFGQLRDIFLEEDFARMKMRLNGYKLSCLKNKSPTGVKRLKALEELLKTI